MSLVILSLQLRDAAWASLFRLRLSLLLLVPAPGKSGAFNALQKLFHNRELRQLRRQRVREHHGLGWLLESLCRKATEWENNLTYIPPLH